MMSADTDNKISKTGSLNRFNMADKTLVAVFILFLLALALKMNFPGSVWAEGLMFTAEAALVGGIADWFAVTALFKKPLGIPWHTALLPRRREAFTRSCIRMIQTEFLSRRKIYKMICDADVLSKGLKWLAKPENKEYFIHLVIDFLAEKVQHTDVKQAARVYYPKIAVILKQESMRHLAERLRNIMIKSGNDEIAVNKVLAVLADYFDGDAGRGRILSFVEAYQRRYTKNGLSGLMLSIALATNTLDPEELADVIHQRIGELIVQASDAKGEVHANLVRLFDELMAAFDDDDDWIASLDDLQSSFIEDDALERVIENTIQNFCDYFLKNSSEGNKLHMAITHIFSSEIDKCIDKLNANEEFKAKINSFVMDVLHRAAIKGEGAVLDLARKFLEGLSDEQLNELVYGKVEQDMIWIRLNGSIVGGIIGAAVFIVLELVK